MRKARKSKVREEYKLKRNEVNIMIRKAKSDYTRTLLSENSRNLDGFGAAMKCVFLSKAKKIKSVKWFVISPVRSTKLNEIAISFCNHFPLSHQL